MDNRYDRGDAAGNSPYNYRPPPTGPGGPYGAPEGQNPYGAPGSPYSAPGPAAPYDANAGQPVPPAPVIPTYTAAKKKARGSQNARRAIIMLVAVAVLFALAWFITRMIQGWHDEKNPLTSNLAPQTVAAAPKELEAPAAPLGELPTVDNTGWNTITPVEAEAPPVTEPDSRMIGLPENGRIGMEYFDTAVFVGDSLTQGLQIYTQGIPNAKYCAYKGASPRAIYSGEAVRRLDGASEVPMDALVSYQPDNVYILMGTNAMVAMDDESLLGYYGEMINAMREALHPEVSIYIQSITPVLQGVDPRFDMERIGNLNNALAKMAVEKNCYFLDLHEALAGDDGWMRLDYGATRDGYHMNPSGYAAWVEYLRTHTAYNRRHAHLYQEEPNYYQQLPPPEEE